MARNKVQFQKELGRRHSVTQTAAWPLKHKPAQVMIERNAAKRLEGEVQWTTPISAASTKEHTGAARRGRRLSWPPFR
jgi:hypothetical protein